MKRYLIVILFAFAGLPSALRAAPGPIVPVFRSGESGYGTFRIPALLRLPDGTLLAFSEGRKNGLDDFGNIQIVMKRSRDGGRHWGALQVVASNRNLQADNAAPVLDRTDPACPGGRLFLFYNTGNEPEGLLRRGKGVREVWYRTSTDGGKTWSDPVNITTEVSRPYQPSYNPAYDFSQDWRSYANTPGHAMQFEDGPYRGRIYVAFNHSAGKPQAHFADYHAMGFYSDDHGETFKLSDPVSFPGGNECMAAPLPQGGLLLNIRNQYEEPRCRILARSSDGGLHWDSVYYAYDLPDPVCQGSMVPLGWFRGRYLLAFCNNIDTLKRNHLGLHFSADGGRHWIPGPEVEEAPPGYKGDFSGYSDIQLLDRRHLGVLYERDFYREIAFRVMPVSDRRILKARHRRNRQP